MKSQRLACSISKKVRQEVLERDNHQCVVCGTRYHLTLAHVFYSRAHAGLGVKENLATLCMSCHHLIDNGNDYKKSQLIKYDVESYLKGLYDIDLTKLKYKNRWIR
jgi:hypothetical protein